MEHRFALRAKHSFLEGACLVPFSQNINVVKLITSHTQPNNIKLLNLGLYYACKNDNIDIVVYLIECGANNFNWALRGAEKSGNDILINLMKHTQLHTEECWDCWRCK